MKKMKTMTIKNKFIKLFEEYNINSKIEDFFIIGYGNSALKKFKKLEDFMKWIEHHNLEYNEENYIFANCNETWLIPKSILKEEEPYVEIAIRAEQGWERIKDFKVDVEELHDNMFSNRFYDIYLRLGIDEINIENKSKIENMLEFIKPKYKISLKKHLKKIGIIKSNTNKTQKKMFEKDVYKGIKLAGDTEEDIYVLKGIIDNLKKEYNIDIHSNKVRLMRFGNVGKGVSGTFSPKSKMIKLNKESAYLGDEYFYDIIIHEYTHAIDINFELTLMLLPFYKKCIKMLYKETRDELFNVDVKLSTKINIPINKIYGDYYSNVMNKLGFHSNTYGLINPKEFTATLMEDYFTKDDFDVNDDLLELCKKIHRKYY